MTQETEVQPWVLDPDLPLSHLTSLSLSFIIYQMRKMLISTLLYTLFTSGNVHLTSLSLSFIIYQMRKVLISIPVCIPFTSRSSC